MEPSRKNDVSRVSHGAALNKDTLSRSASNTRTEHRTFYDDPVSVRQWAAETDPNTPADFAEYGFPNASHGAEMTGFCATAQLPGSFPVSCPSVSHISYPMTSGFRNEDHSAAYAQSIFNEVAQGSRNPLRLDTHGNMDPMKNYETRSYPTPTAEDMTYSTSTAYCFPYSGGNDFEPRVSDWSTGAFLPDDDFPKASLPCGSQTLAWSPLLATDPSVSSSHSRSSYLAMQPNTPLSPVAQEPNWPAGHGYTQEDTGLYPAFSLGEAFALPAGCQIDQHDAMRFVYSCKDRSQSLIVNIVP